MRTAAAPPSLTLVDIALMTSLGAKTTSLGGTVFESDGLDKTCIAKMAIEKLQDPELNVPSVVAQLHRLCDLGIVQNFGDQLVVTPKGVMALGLSHSRMNTLLRDLRGL